MLENIPSYIMLTFGFTTVATLLCLVWAIGNSDSEPTRKKAIPISIGLAIWLTIQMILTLSNFYKNDTQSFPPKIMLFGVFPAMATILLIFVTQRGRNFVDRLPIKHLTYLHVVRIPVEIVLYWLFLQRAIPEIMTFSGRNFDILAGLTAPLFAYYGLEKSTMKPRNLLIWNFVCLGLLVNIVTIALLSTPSPIQRFGFEQPNLAIFNFPFSWLPVFVVPVVLFSHLVSIRQLLRMLNN